MFVELIELLRCPRPHGGQGEEREEWGEAQLIASATRSEARHIVDGVLGCPVCNAEFPIVAGVVRIDDSEPTAPAKPSAEAAMRLAAFLDLTDSTGFALLCGGWGAHVDLVHRLSETRIVLINPPPNIPPDVAAGVIRTRDSIPFASGSARGVALHESASRDLASSAARVVRPGGRILAPVGIVVPPGVTELARDDQMWVGEKAAATEGTPRLVSIKKASR